MVRELREKGAPEQEVSKAAAELKSRKKTLEAKVRVSQLLIGLCSDSAFSLTCLSSRASLLSFITPTLIKKCCAPSFPITGTGAAAQRGHSGSSEDGRYIEEEVLL